MARVGLSPARVVSEAAAVADEVGLDGLTLAAVAERLGVRLPSLYKHIDGLDAIRRELALMGLEELAQRLGRAAMGRTRRDALVDIAHAYRTFAEERPGLYTATLRAPSADDEELTARAHAVLEQSFAHTRT